MEGNLYQVSVEVNDHAMVTVRAVSRTDARLKAAAWLEQRMNLPAGVWEPGVGGIWVRSKNLAYPPRGWQSHLSGLSGDPSCLVGHAWLRD